MCTDHGATWRVSATGASSSSAFFSRSMISSSTSWTPSFMSSTTSLRNLILGDLSPPLPGPGHPPSMLRGCDSEDTHICHGVCKKSLDTCQNCDCRTHYPRPRSKKVDMRLKIFLILYSITWYTRSPTKHNIY